MRKRDTPKEIHNMSMVYIFFITAMQNVAYSTDENTDPGPIRVQMKTVIAYYSNTIYTSSWISKGTTCAYVNGPQIDRNGTNSRMISSIWCHYSGPPVMCPATFIRMNAYSVTLCGHRPSATSMLNWIRLECHVDHTNYVRVFEQGSRQVSRPATHRIL